MGTYELSDSVECASPLVLVVLSGLVQCIFVLCLPSVYYLLDVSRRTLDPRRHASYPIATVDYKQSLMAWTRKCVSVCSDLCKICSMQDKDKNCSTFFSG
jgi:hypothetical protein